MRRIQGVCSGIRDPDEEKRRARETVISNVVVFALLVGLIRTAPFVLEHL